NGSDIGGSLLVHGDLTLPQGSNVYGDLEVTGGLGGGTSNHVARDAWLDGPVSLQWNALAIARDLYAPSNQVPHGIQVGGMFHNRSLNMTGPCDCGALDVAGIVTAGAQKNDNASISLAPDKLASVSA